MQCPLSVASFLWLREVQALTEARFGQPLAKVHHMGTYSCRRQRGNGSGRWSEHAFANAWDVAAFELADGRWTLANTVRDDMTVALVPFEAMPFELSRLWA